MHGIIKQQVIAYGQHNTSAHTHMLSYLGLWMNRPDMCEHMYQILCTGNEGSRKLIWWHRNFIIHLKTMVIFSWNGCGTMLGRITIYLNTQTYTEVQWWKCKYIYIHMRFPFLAILAIIRITDWYGTSDAYSRDGSNPILTPNFCVHASNFPYAIFFSFSFEKNLVNMKETFLCRRWTQ